MVQQHYLLSKLQGYSTARTMIIFTANAKVKHDKEEEQRGGDEHTTTECLFCFTIGSSTAVSTILRDLAPDWFFLVSTTVHVASAVVGPLPVSTLISTQISLFSSQPGITDERKKQVAQGQYVVSDTRCPALHGCKSE